MQPTSEFHTNRQFNIGV